MRSNVVLNVVLGLRQVAALLAAGADAGAVFGAGRLSALHAAALLWDKSHMGPDAASNEIHAVVRQLLRRGADPNHADAAGRTVHHIAAFTHNYYLLELLLRKHPPPGEYIRGNTVIHHIHVFHI